MNTQQPEKNIFDRVQDNLNFINNLNPHDVSDNNLNRLKDILTMSLHLVNNTIEERKGKIISIVSDRAMQEVNELKQHLKECVILQKELLTLQNK